MSFVHLHVHTQYSLLDGANKLAPLLDHARQSGMPAMAITDHGNMFGAVEFYKKASERGIKPIIGCEAYLAPGSRTDRGLAVKADDFEGAGNYHLILLVQNHTGYRNLCQLLTVAYREGLYYKPRIDKEILAEHSEGLIALSGCLSGELARALRAGRKDKAREVAESYARMFPGRFYIELQDNKLHGPYNEALRELANQLGLPMVATNDCHYLHRADARAHEVLLCIQTGKTMADETRWRFDTDELYVKTPAEMEAAFADDLTPVRNTLEIANRVDFQFDFGKFHFPRYQMSQEELERAGAAGDEEAAFQRLLEERTREGLRQRLEELHARRGDFDETPYHQRLDRELPVIREMGFSGYMLIVADFINYARGLGIPVGPGRGSVVGSLVSYALRITELDPIEHKLLFERWLNPGRKSMPDIDVDFCFERRDEIIDYVRRKYGEEKVAQIITFGTIKGKQAIRDVGRVLGLSFAETDRICKLYPAPKQGRDFPLEDALKMEPRLREERQKYPELFEFAFKLEGLLRHASRHAAGVVIADGPLDEMVPLYADKERAEGAPAITQYSMKFVEDIGLVKFDFLGLKNLTLIQDTLELIKAGGKTPPDLHRLPLDDPDAYRLLARGDTVGVFQMESSGMRRFVTDLKPTCFDDIIAAGSLFRPGPLDAVVDGKTMVQHYVDRKHGREPVKYQHPLLEPVLRDTYGVIIYQEQVMRVAQALAGYTLEQADILRAAMGKKNKAVMERERERFIQGAVDNGVDKETAQAIFEQIETFASYGFNRSHAAAYALTTYTTAYLKAHFPRQFMAALMSLDMDDTDKTYKNIAALREMGIPLLPPDINQSMVKFSVDGEAIRFGLAAVRGVGVKTAQAIVEERRQNGDFASLWDFCARLGSQTLNRRTLEALIKCGAFDSTGITRATAMAQLDTILRALQRKEVVRSQMGLFADAFAPALPERSESLPEWPDNEKLRAEKEALGFYISAHPLDKYQEALRVLKTVSTAALSTEQDGSRVDLAGTIQSVKLKNNKAGRRYATFVLEDREGAVEVIVWPETYQRVEQVVHSEEPVLARGKLDLDEERAQIILDDLVPLRVALAQAVREAHVFARRERIDQAKISYLAELLAKNPGHCRTFLHLILDSDEEAIFELGERFRLEPSPELLQEVKQALGGCSVELSA